MFGILEGSVRLVRTNSSAQDRYEVIRIGHIFGSESLVVEEHRCLCTATAISFCCLIVINRENFLFAVQEAPMFAIGLLASIDARL